MKKTDVNQDKYERAIQNKATKIDCGRVAVVLLLMRRVNIAAEHNLAISRKGGRKQT